jgi:Glycosyltransferase sugar-binding region containing DXD motif
MPIPKIIIQTWKTKKTEDLPTYYKKTQNLIFQNNPDYRYIFFDDDDIKRFVRNKYPAFEGLIKRFKQKIQIIDFFRLLAVYEYGGFYFDMDVEVIKNLDPLLEYDCIFPVEMRRNNRILNDMNYDYNLGNYAFAASPKNQVIWNIIQGIVKVMDDPDSLSLGFSKTFAPDSLENDRNLMHEYVYHTTGPIIVSKIVFDSLAEGHSIKLLHPKNWPSRSSWYRFGDFAKHTMTGTWKPDGIGEINMANMEKSGILDGKDPLYADVEKKTPNTGILYKACDWSGINKIWESFQIENMTVSDLVADPETVLIIVLITGIIFILLIMCSLSLLGCDEDVAIYGLENCD